MAKAKFKDSQGNIRSLNNVKINYAKEDDWQPEPDWWDIDKILEEDEEDCYGKMIGLLSDKLDTILFQNPTRHKFFKIKMSDGTVYENVTSNITHTWDKSKDKECSLGYKTRYFILYFSNDCNDVARDFITREVGIIYFILKSVSLKFLDNSSNQTWIASNWNTIEAFCTIDGAKIYGSNGLLNGCRKLRKISEIYTEGLTGAWLNNVHVFGGCFLLKPEEIKKYKWNPNSLQLNHTFDNYLGQYIPYIDTYKIQNFDRTFANTTLLSKIENLDFDSATYIANTFAGAYLLNEISNISNIKINGLAFNDCKLLNHDTLIRILNALYDYSDGETHTITLGSTNIAKLTSEELAIGQNKNWTIS